MSLGGQTLPARQPADNLDAVGGFLGGLRKFRFLGGLQPRAMVTEGTLKVEAHAGGKLAKATDAATFKAENTEEAHSGKAALANAVEAKVAEVHSAVDNATAAATTTAAAAANAAAQVTAAEAIEANTTEANHSSSGARPSGVRALSLVERAWDQGQSCSGEVEGADGVQGSSVKTVIGNRFLFGGRA